MALSNLGLIQMGGAMLRPGGSLGDGFLAYGDGMVRDDQMKTTALYRQAQAQSLNSAAMKHQMELEAARAQAEARKNFQTLFASRVGGQPATVSQAPAPAAPESGLNGPLGSGTFGIDPLTAMAQPSAPAASTPANKPLWDALLFQRGLDAGYKREDLEAMARANDLGMPEVARTIEQADDLGNPQTVQFDKQGRPVGAPIRKPVSLNMEDFGGHKQFTNPHTGAIVGNQFGKTNSPDSILSAETTKRGQNMTDARAREFNANTAAATQATKELAQSTKHWEKVSDLRKEFAGLPEVKHYKEVIPAQKSATDAIQRDTAQADINLVYATAKIFDPTSVVREGEYSTVNSSAPPAERVQGLLNHLMGGGKLTPATRQALLREINSRAEAAQGSYAAARQAFTGIATRNGFAPSDVFADLPELAKPPAKEAGAPSRLPTAAEIDAEIARREQGKGR